MSTINPAALDPFVSNPPDGSGDPANPTNYEPATERAVRDPVQTQFEAAKTDVEALETSVASKADQTDLDAHTGAANPHSGSASDADVTTAVSNHDDSPAAHGGVEAAFLAHDAELSGQSPDPHNSGAYTNGVVSAHAASPTGHPLATTGSAGFLTQLSGTATEYLDGSGVFSTPAGGGGSPLTTKGDLFTHDLLVDTRFPVGADGLVLEADSSQATGLKWGPKSSTGGGDVSGGSTSIDEEYAAYNGTTGKVIQALGKLRQIGENLYLQTTGAGTFGLIIRRGVEAISGFIAWNHDTETLVIGTAASASGKIQINAANSQNEAEVSGGFALPTGAGVTGGFMGAGTINAKAGYIEGDQIVVQPGAIASGSMTASNGTGGITDSGIVAANVVATTGSAISDNALLAWDSAAGQALDSNLTSGDTPQQFVDGAAGELAEYPSTSKVIRPSGIVAADLPTINRTDDPTGAVRMAVVTTMPGVPAADTLYFVTT